MSRPALPVVLALLLAAAPPAAAATLTIVNVDGAGEGFNDPTPVAPVGGNPGTTLGAQRLIAFQEAADIWGSILDSSVQINIQASFDALSCDPNGAVLGSAGAIQVLSDFPGAPFSGTWYHIALANAIAGVDQSTGPPGSGADDLRARFNSSIDNNDSCLTGTNWYLGLDNNPPGNDINLLVVLLHEFAHGLGFSTFVNKSTGAYLGPPFQPDIYARFILDNSNGLHWNEMTNNQRSSSAVNTGNVVWDGPNVTAAAPGVLQGAPQLFINSPPAISGPLQVGIALFGPPLSSTPVTGDMVLADDGSGTTSDGCEAFINGGAVAGNIALVDRGSCAFTIKVKNAQNAGAIGTVVANNTTGLINMSGTDPNIVIPSLFISQADGNDIKAELPGVNASLQLDPNHLSGADGSDRVMLFAPNPVLSGSSISHWDVTVSPDLLMEPAISPSLISEVDLTDEQMVDIGWSLLASGAGAGAVPDGASLPGTPLSIAEAGGGDVTLSWGDSCAASDDDFEVYEGTLTAPGASLVDHVPVACSTSGATSLTFTPSGTSAYYLVVPRNSSREGSYGLDGGGFERPDSLLACLPQEVLAVCP